MKENYYQSIVKQIIGQQLSLKAAATINNRLENIWPNLRPGILENIDDEELRSAGVSRPKIKYIRDLSQKYLKEEIHLEKIHMLGDEEIISVLTSVKGIGKWTSEMFLIFSLGRQDILSYTDVSIKNAIRWLYQIDKEEPLDLDCFCNKWKPYNTIASLYLWEAINTELIKNKSL